MKKWMFAALVAMIAFAMIGCPTGDGDDNNGEGSGQKWTVSFELGDHAKAGLTAPAAKEIEDSTPIPTSGWLPALPEGEDASWVAGAWVLKGTTTRAAGYEVKSDITLEPQWLPPITITFINWEGDTATPFVDKIPQGYSFKDVNKTFPTPTRADYQFAYWVFAGSDGKPGTSKVTFEDAINEDATIIGIWYDIGFKTLADKTTAEKVRLTNGGMIVYEFDLATALSKSVVTIDDLVDITGITLKQALSEATYKSVQVRAFRVLGPYAFHDNTDFVINESSWSNGDVLYGDFKKTKEEYYIAKLNGDSAAASNVTDMRRFNKFHPFFIYNGTQETGEGRDADGRWDRPIGTEVSGVTTVTYDEWFDVTYALNGAIPANDDSGARSLGATLYRLKEASADIHAYQTNYNKVYFAFGPSTADATNAAIYMMKDVKLTFTDGTTVDGKVPDFDGVSSTWDQSFACYEDDSRHVNWRGAPATAIADRTEGTFEEDISAYPRNEAPNAEGYGSFYLRLATWKDTTSQAGHPFPAGTYSGKYNKGPLSLTYNATDAKIAISLTPAQILTLEEATPNIKITIDGTTGGESNNYWRFYLGDTTQSTWNISTGSGRINAPSGESGIQKILDGLALDPDTNDPLGYTNDSIPQGRALDIRHFILQMGDSGGGGGYTYNNTPETLVINSIKIDYRIIPPTPCDCATAATEGACIPFVGTHTCNADPAQKIICSCAYTAYGDPLDFSTVTGIMQSGTARFTVLKNNGGLLITHREEDHACIDLDPNDPVFASVGATTDYTVTVKGKAYETTPASNIQITQANSPWGTLGQQAITGPGAVDFTLTQDVTGADITAKIRIRVHNGATPRPVFIITSVKVEPKAGGAALVDKTF